MEIPGMRKLLYSPSLFVIIIQIFFLLKVATQLARQVQQERTKVVCSNKVGRSRLAQGHSRNGPRTYECLILKSLFDSEISYVCMHK